MSYLFVPGTEESTSDCASRCRLLARSVGWRGKLRPAKSWSAACRKGGWIQRLFGAMPRPSTASRGMASWIASLRASRANLGAPPESARGSKTSATLASTLSAPLARWDQDSCSWKTCRGLFDKDFPTFSGAWPTSGTMRSGACFPLPESAPLIDGSESSCWPTATAGDSKGSGSAAYSTESDDKSETPEIRPGHSPPPSHQALLPGSGSESSPAPGLQWMTPRVANIKGSKKRRASWENHSLDSQAREVWAENLKARLNPDFVEWLMGLPHGWTDSECSETAWSHWLQLMRSALSPHESTHKP
jgi:hypothetical protein